jgi:hypothetical protein
MAILGQNYVDLSPLFNLNPTRNYLLASLGLLMAWAFLLIKWR